MSDRLWIAHSEDLRSDCDPGCKELIRCKDCKWYKSIFSWNCKEHKVCVREPSEPPREPNDYCSYGERKDES